MANQGSRNLGFFWWRGFASSELSDMPIVGESSEQAAAATFSAVGLLSASAWRAYRHMGTTRTALATNYGGKFGFSLVIEGYEYVITDAADTSKVVTAYSGTGWSQALAGLTVAGIYKQEIKPWSDDIDVPTLTFRIKDCDGNDTFGKAVWKTKPTYSSRLSATFEPATDGTGTLTVQSQSEFPASGTVFLGPRALTYSGKTGSTVFDVSNAGVYQPFEAGSGNVYSKPFKLPAAYNFDVSANPTVTDVPSKWIGRKVALYIHRISGGVWDTRAEAQLEFAGKIVDIADSDDGQTVLMCQDLREDMRNALLGENQWRGYVSPGLRVNAGDKFRVLEGISGTYIESILTVVASGAGAGEINEGIYQIPDFLSVLNNWIAGAGLTGTMSLAMLPKLDGAIVVGIIYSKTGATDFGVSLSTTSKSAIEALGFREYNSGANYVFGGIEYWVGLNTYNTGEQDGGIRFAELPPGQYSVELSKFQIIPIEQEEGEWFDNTGYLPTSLKNYTSDLTGEFGIAMIGKNYYYVRYPGDSTLQVLGDANGLMKKTAKEDTSKETVEDESVHIEVKQVIVLMGEFKTLITKLMASTKGLVNHDDYDVLPFGAGIPWSLLGDPWLNSVATVQEQSNTPSFSLMIEKPTRLLDVLAPEMLLRAAWIVFKDGGYQMVPLATPSALNPDHVLDETNKAETDGNPGLSTSVVTDEFMRNVVKIEYKQPGRDDSTLTIKDKTSIEQYGEKPLTIDAKNLYGSAAQIGTSVETLSTSLGTKIFPYFAKPLKIISRTISPHLYHAAPGDTVTLTDSYARSPESGRRGISNRGGILLSVAHAFGHEGQQLYGEVSILLTDEERGYALAPAAEIDTTYTSGLYTNGYDSTNFRLKLKQHQFSAATDSKDVSSFADDDKVRIVEIDPSDPASPDAWSRDIDTTSVADDYIQLTAAISSPAWSGSSTKRFAVVPQAYTAVQDSQKTGSFQADKTDGMILDDAKPNTYVEGKVAAFSLSNATTLPTLLPDELCGDGKPFTPLHIKAAGDILNNFVSYKGAPNMPVMLTTPYVSNAVIYGAAMVFPFFIGGICPPGKTRSIYLAPFFKVDSGGTASVRITSCRFPPKNDDTGLVFPGQVHQEEWTTTGTSYAEGTVTALTPVRAVLAARHTYLIVEVKSSSALYSASFLGVSSLYLGPITDA